MTRTKEIFLAALCLILGMAVASDSLSQTRPAQSPSKTAAGNTQLTWYGQAAFKLVTPAGHILLIDPWILNPANQHGKEDLAAIDKADLILISHGHFDHVGDAVEIAQRTKARLVTNFDLGDALARYGGYPKEQMGFDSLGNFGGVMEFFDGEVKVALVPAVHSSSVKGAGEELHFGGAPGGFVIMIKNGPAIYHTGDTDLFSDMALVKKYGRIDVMLACIGDHFTMGPERAAAAVALVNPVKVVPMHYGTFVPLMTGTPEKFSAALNRLGLGKKFMLMSVGQPVKM